MQRDFRLADSLGFQSVEKRPGEVQPGCGGSHGAFLFCIHRLVAFPIRNRFGWLTLDVRGQRRFANLRQQLKNIRSVRHLEEVLAGFVFVDGRHPVVGRSSFEVVQLDACAVVNAFAGTEHAPPSPGGVLLSQQDFNPRSVAIFLPPHPCGDDTGIVHNQQVARFEAVGQIGELPVGQALGQALHNQQAGGIPALRRMLCNQFWREIVVEIGRSHGRSLPVFRQECDSFAI